MAGNFKTYSSFSGADITAVIAGKQFATLQAISYSVTREKGPVYTMGSPDPKAFARGKRAIAGTVVFVTIDSTSLLAPFLENPNDPGSQFYAKVGDQRVALASDDLFNSTSAYGNLPGGATVQNAGSQASLSTIWYADQLLPFNVNLSAVNEAGEIAKKSIIGVELMNEGGGVSVDDLVLEEQYTYICRYITPWLKVQTNSSNIKAVETING